MDPNIKKDISKLIKEVKVSLKKCDADALKLQSDHVIHSAGIYQDIDTRTLAIIVYALSKIVAREQQPKTIKDILKFIQSKLTLAQKALKTNDIIEYRKQIKLILKELGRLEKKFGKYVMEVLQQAKIKKGSKIVEHGISVGRAAELMGINSWELQTFMGNIKDETVEGIPINQRLSFARRLFK